MYATILTLLVLGVVGMDPNYLTTLRYRSTMRVKPFSMLPQPNYYFLDGATVSIEFGYVPQHDRLHVDYQGSYPITGRFDVATGVLNLEGAAPISEYAVAISSVVFVTTSENGVDKQITFTFGKGVMYHSVTKHFYKYVYTPLAWEQAVVACAADSYMGFSGYLATITSEDELSQVGSKIKSTVWLGGSDTQTPNTWKWVDGPEGKENGGSGREFWQGLSVYDGGATPNNLRFASWYRFQPDNANGQGQSYVSLIPTAEMGISYFDDSSNTDGITGYICEYGGLDPANVTATVGQFTDSTLLLFDCTLFDSSTECSNRKDLGCVWLSSSCQTSSCARHATQHRCVADWKCEWAADGEIGFCTETACAKYGDAATCQLDPTTCTTARATGPSQCRVAQCYDLSSSCLCASKSECAWRDGMCSSTATIDCSGMDTVYLLDSNEELAVEFSRYTTGFFGLTQLIAETDVSLTQQTAGTPATSSTPGARLGFVQYAGPAAYVTPTGVGSGGRLSGSITEVLQDILWHQQLYSGSIVTREAGPGLEQALQMMTDGSMRSKYIVLFASGLVTDAAALAADKSKNPQAILNRIASQGIVIIGVAIRTTEPMTLNGRNAIDSLTMLTSNVVDMPLTHVKELVLEGQCGTNPLSIGRFTTKKSTTITCATMMSRDNCTRIPSCGWDTATKVCVNAACLGYCNSAQCGTDPTCVYSGNQCVQKCPTLSQAQCTIPSCQWNVAGKYCGNAPCVANPTEDACIADTNGCTYNPRWATPCKPTPCKYTNESSCTANPMCAWNQGCFLNSCYNANQNDCSALVQCMWNVQSSQCQLNICGGYQSENTCQADRRCAWNVSNAPAACGPAQCRYYNVYSDAQSKCKADSSCYWASAQESGYGIEMCIVETCDLLKTACRCTSKNGCVWKNNTCKDTTFVQCPAIDVVFLIEATEYMTRAFGRHPNGFIGAVESIRSWSWDAPLSPAVGSSGFRLGIVGYGSPTVALRANPAIGAKGNITADITAWADVGGELDDFLRQQTAYSQSSEGNVAIRKGLESALSLFKMNANGNRRRMLIILGAQPITDGNGQFGSLIAEVEALGIQIFSNILRRFMTLTPLDRQAQSLIEPIASDPPSMHFLFTTIDDMRDAVLGSFCDPSTLTGQALGISRDGTLPCNWLNGATECQIQGSCVYNSSALPSCPRSNECPNLGCAVLPPVLAKQFECKHCVLKSGAFECSRSQNNLPPPGLCLPSPCMKSYCNETTCGMGASCRWAGDSTRCERRMCTATTVDACNADLGCVWIDATTNPAIPTTGCYKSICGGLRQPETCAALITQVGTSDTFPCTFVESLTPGICAQQRCPNLQKTNCAMYPAQCGYNDVSSSSQKCFDKQCQYTTNELCAADARCYWDPFHRLPGQMGTCRQRITDCVLSGYSAWSPCTASCGNTSIRYKARTVLQFPSTGGLSCPDVAATMGRSCQPSDTNCQPGDMTMVVSKTCTTQPGWEVDCVAHCQPLSSSACANDISCEWNAGACVPRPFMGCESIESAAACNATDMCSWDESLSFCQTTVKVCRQSTQETCNGQNKCMWRTGSSANALAQGIGVSAQLINPGQKSIFVFPNVAVNGDAIIQGAVIAIENNYQRQKDILRLAYPAPIASTWIASSGTLLLSGNATLTEYSAAIRFVVFETTSLRGLPRNITWSYGTRTIFSINTGHYYKFMPQVAATWEDARAACSASMHFGLRGYLATVTSAVENNILSSSLSSEGWISGDDATIDGWQWSTGPEKQTPFWRGGSSLVGGYAPPGAYANWNTLNGEPRADSQGYRHPYLNVTGYWSAYAATFTKAKGFFCEYGGTDETINVPFAIAGATVIGVGGCVPSSSCGFHSDAVNCERDDECQWTGDQCISGCGIRASIAECETGTSSQCQWDTTILPPQCDINVCNGLGLFTCGMNPRCLWDAEKGCIYRTGCQQFLDEPTCASMSSCTWTISTALCVNRPCESLRSQAVCSTNPLCEWSDMLGCSPVTCKYGSSSECRSDSRCTWSESEGSSVGYFSGSPAVLVFTDGVQAPNDITTLIDGFTVTISEGFQRGRDILSINPSLNAAGSYIVTFDALTGILSARVSPGVTVNALTGFRFMQAGVAFSTSSLSTQRRRVAYVLALRASASESNEKFFQLNATTAATYAAAKAVCAGSRLFNLQGRVATVTTQMDALRLAALGAAGWIGAVGDAQSAWRWDGGNSTPFWRGYGAQGTPTSGAFAQWAVGEPRNLDTNAVIYTHRDTSGYVGSWRSSKATLSVPLPVVCEFGGPSNPPAQVISGVRAVKPSGCFSVPCLGYPQAQCASSPQCAWRSTAAGASCQIDTWCTEATTVGACERRELCYWSYASGMCRTGPDNFCRSQPLGTCADYPQCRWDTSILPQNPAQSGSCVLANCAKYPTEDSCTASPLCRWDASQRCADRLCGYFTDASCWADSLCRWDYPTARCSPSPCYTNATACAVESYCKRVNGECHYVRCAERTKEVCLLDNACLFSAQAGCYMPNCETAASEKDCATRKECYYSYDPNVCLAAQCTSQSTMSDCERIIGGLRQCRWDAAQRSCRELTVIERYAPSAPAQCETERDIPPIWLYALVGVVVLLLLLILWRLYLAYAKGMSIFAPRRKTVRYNPHQQYAGDLIGETDEREEETNAPRRPTIHDL